MVVGEVLAWGEGQKPAHSQRDWPIDEDLWKKLHPMAKTDKQTDRQTDIETLSKTDRPIYIYIFRGREIVNF